MKKSGTLALAGFAGLWFAGIAAGQSINAAGATFPNAIYSQWFNEFKNKTGAQINYQSIGSGAGIQQLTAGTVDFGASDAPMTDAQIAELKVKPLHFPTVLGGVAIIYNVPGVSQQLKFSADTVAGIFLGYGLVIGVLGSGLGLLLGYLVIHNINELHQKMGQWLHLQIWNARTYMFDTIPNTMETRDVVVIVTVAIISAVH